MFSTGVRSTQLTDDQLRATLCRRFKLDDAAYARLLAEQAHTLEGSVDAGIACQHLDELRDLGLKVQLEHKVSPAETGDFASSCTRTDLDMLRVQALLQSYPDGTDKPA